MDLVQLGSALLGTPEVERQRDDTHKRYEKQIAEINQALGIKTTLGEQAPEPVTQKE